MKIIKLTIIGCLFTLLLTMGVSGSFSAEKDTSISKKIDKPSLSNSNGKSSPTTKTSTSSGGSNSIECEYEYYFTPQGVITKKYCVEPEELSRECSAFGRC